MAVGRRDRVQFGRGGRNLSGATMWVEVGETGIKTGCTPLRR